MATMELTRFEELWHRRDLLNQLFIRDLKVKYKNSILGVFWSLLSPILIVTIYTLVFSIIMRFRTVYPYPLFLLSVWLPWQFMNTSLVLASSILIEHGDLMNKIYFPRIFLPLANLFTNLINFGISLLLFFILRTYYLNDYSMVILLFPVVLLIHLLFSLGLSLLISMGTVFYRDLRYFLDIFMLMWFFGSPIIYGVELVPDWLLKIYLINPFASFSILYRSVLLSNGYEPQIFWALLISAVWAFGSLYAGIRLFYKYENSMVKEL